jgi:hypothetical protein
MPRIEANLDAGLNTQDDPKRVGLNGFVQLQNIRHVNGKIIKRFGTGAQSSNISGNDASNPSCIINNAGIFVHRKLTGAKISDVSANKITFTASNGRMNLDDTSGLTIPGQTADFRNIFKAGDTIVLSTSATDGGVACQNKDKALVIESVDSATQITFKTAVIDEELDGGSVTAQFTFVFDRNDDGATPNNLQINDANSFDGRALIVTYADGTNMEIGMLNANDYGDLDTIATIANASDIHIRMRTYTDGVRFACGLDNSPLLFKYINRQHFNGMLTHDYNSDAHTMYPTWFMDTAVPIEQANTYTVDSVSSPEFISGSLDLSNNVYDYKFIPLYDGVQEALLDDAVINESSSLVSNRNVEKSGILSLERSAFKLTGKIDTRNFNPRTSGLNVYRSTNGGTYYKIKTIYMGDNDPNQKQLDLYAANDILFFKGNTAPVAATFNSVNLIVDGFRYQPKDGGTTPDFDGTGYNLVNTDTDTGYASNFDIEVSTSANMSPGYYGSEKIYKFNHKSEDTETIFADNGECTGGSANGGWYFAGDELIDNIDLEDDVGGGSGDSIDMVSDDTGTAGPFGTAFGTGNSGNGSFTPHLKFTHDGDPNEDLRRIDVFSSLNTSAEYIISGWIRAEGFNRSDASWRLFLSTSNSLTDANAPADIVTIAEGKGGERNQNIDKWRWFQYTVGPVSDIVMYMSMNVIGDIYNGARVYVKALSCRPSVSNFTLNDNCTAFLGKQIGMSSHLSDLGLPNGVLKGNSIQEHDDNPVKNYPTNLTADRAEVVDNFDSFLRSEILVPDLGGSAADGTPGEDTFLFGTSNYQFYSNGTGTSAATNRYVLFDFYDPGLPDGARHPNEGITSLDVKFKYATMLNGRQFVANVKITGDEDTEEYPNFVMYSNPGSPDSIPTSNFIKLDDLQGGEIVGIETLMSDIVVFMTKGIFRINVPSGDPTNWSLVESHPNIGCLNDKGITKAPNGIFFLSNEDVIFLDSGFQATPITYPIRDDYQSTVASSSSIMKTHYDAKYNKLYITKSVSSDTEFYIYDIFRQVWYTEKHTGVEYDEFSFDNNNNTLLIESATNSNVRKAVDTSEYRDKGSVAIEMIAQTGEQELTPYDQNAYIRRVNTNTNKGSGSGTALDLQVVSGSTFTENNFLNGVQSTRTSQRGKSVQVKISDDSSAENEIKEISRLEVEYE